MKKDNVMYCIKAIPSNPDSNLGRYVSKEGLTTNKIDDILVVEAFNVLYGACEHWNGFSDDEYKVVDFNYDRIKKELEDLAKED